MGKRVAQVLEAPFGKVRGLARLLLMERFHDRDAQVHRVHGNGCPSQPSLTPMPNTLHRWSTVNGSASAA